jgi:hypothetical protein
VAHLFNLLHKRLGFHDSRMPLRTDGFRPAGGEQLALF